MKAAELGKVSRNTLRVVRAGGLEDDFEAEVPLVRRSMEEYEDFKVDIAKRLRGVKEEQEHAHSKLVDCYVAP